MAEELEQWQAAALAGVKPQTWSGYVARGQAPAPRRHVGRTPLWDAAEVRAWLESRPGRGSRSTPRARTRAQERQSRGEPQA